MRHQSRYSPYAKKMALEALVEIFPNREALSIMRALTEDLEPIRNFEENDLQLEAAVKRVLLGEPVQYITGKAHFYGKAFKVNPNVLIPRPETEELVFEALKFIPSNVDFRLWDIGTGSGCISLIIGEQKPHSYILASDISKLALEVASENALVLKVKNVHFLQHDFLRESPSEGMRFDMLISNPPYVCVSEKTRMSDSTLLHEPSTALFPKGEDPLSFYRRLCEISSLVLNHNGVVMAEINEYRAEETAQIFRPFFQSVVIKKDLQGKCRVLIATGLRGEI